VTSKVCEQLHQLCHAKGICAASPAGEEQQESLVQSVQDELQQLEVVEED
jgi:hypothetical protein